MSEMLRRGIDLYGREGASRRAATTSYDDERLEPNPRLAPMAWLG